jgi:hypothetical protein
MNKVERYSVTFILVMNIFAFGMLMVVLGNASVVEDLTYIGTADASFLVIIAIFGLVSNLILGWLLFRILRRAFRQRGTSGRITGE